MTAPASLVHFPKLHPALCLEHRASTPLLELRLDAFMGWAREARVKELDALRLMLVNTLTALWQARATERCGDLRWRLDVVEARLQRARRRVGPPASPAR